MFAYIHPCNIHNKPNLVTKILFISMKSPRKLHFSSFFSVYLFVYSLIHTKYIQFNRYLYFQLITGYDC